MSVSSRLTLSSPMYVGTIQFIEDLNRTKRGRRKFPLLVSCLPPSVGTCYLFWSSDWNLNHEFLCSQALRLGLNNTTSFPGSPVCKQQIMGCLSLHNFVSHFLMTYKYIQMHIYLRNLLTRIPSWNWYWPQGLG